MPNFTKSESADISTELQIQREITKLNLVRIHFITILSLFYFSFIFIINIYSHFIWKFDQTSLTLYIIPYTFAFSLNAIILYFIKKPTHPFMQKHHKKIPMFYFSAMLTISLVISMLDFHYYNHITVYLAYLIICTAVLIQPLIKTLLPASLSVLLLSISILAEGNWQFEEQFSMLLFIFVALITVSLSYYNYNTIHYNFKQHHLLILEKERSQILTDKLRIAAQTDELTKVANRHGYYDYLSSLELKLPLRITTLMIDIDSFKNYNDYYGHIVGDLVLSKVATCLDEVCQHSERFAVRWGGEEFLIILQNHSDDEINTVYEQFIEKIARHNIEHHASGTSNMLTFSAGGNTSIVSSLDNIHQSIHFADEAQYIVKHSTKNRLLLMNDGRLKEDLMQH